MDREVLIQDVRHILDEQELQGNDDISIEDNLPIDDRIISLYGSVFNEVQRISPQSQLKLYPLTGEHTPDIDYGTGEISLPCDYLRLGRLRMKGWRRTVTRVVSEDTPEALYQLNKETRGGCVDPVVVESCDKSRLWYYSLPCWYESHDIEEASYVRKSKGPEEDYLGAESYDLLRWMLARETAHTLGRDTNNMTNIIKEKIQTLDGRS